MTAHLEIARERYLDLMANGATAAIAAARATEDADVFMAIYSAPTAPASGKPLVGCRACHGSGGKRSAPCKVCGGAGKVTP